MVATVAEEYTAIKVREQFLAFFESKQHVKMPSSSLIPYNDSSVLLTSAGMQQMIPYFLQQETPPAKRLTTIQKCFRTVNIDTVGDTRHCTFFEMMGNFSIGDYFKHEAIAFAWELLTDIYKLDPARLFPTVHPTDKDAPAYWTEIAHIPDEKIVRLEDNWWERTGLAGPCGPDSEIYYDRGTQYGCGKASCQPGCDCDRFLEIWNLVFMELYGDMEGNKSPLNQKNIDTGLGFERLLMVLQNVESVFDTDIFKPVIEKTASLCKTHYGSSEEKDISLRVITDHIRGLVFMAADGVSPSNEGRGYIFRRVLRRAVRHGHALGVQNTFLSEIAMVVIEHMGVHYTELRAQQEHILEILHIEEEKFTRTLQSGTGILEKYIQETQQTGGTILSGEVAFKLADTYGFPLELTQDIANSHNLSVDTGRFTEELQRQQIRSRAATSFTLEENNAVFTQILQSKGETAFKGYTSFEEEPRIIAIVVDGQIIEELRAPQAATLILDKTPFYGESGGQVGDQGMIQGPVGSFHVHNTRKPIKGIFAHYGVLSEGSLQVRQQVHARIDIHRRESIMRNHSATHLLQKALRDILGTYVEQRGSLVDRDKLRFDFTSVQPLTADILDQIDRTINQKIRANIAVQTSIMQLDEAKQLGAMALFGEKYDQTVRVVTIGDSIELCGGTHCSMTGQIGTYVTLQEGSIAAGVRRIEAITGEAAIEYMKDQQRMLQTIGSIVQAQPGEELSRTEKIREDLVTAKHTIKLLQQQLLTYQEEMLRKKIHTVGSLQVLTSYTPVQTREMLHEMVHSLQRGNPPIDVLALAYTEKERVSFLIRLSSNAIEQGYDAAILAGDIGKSLSGSGGGKKDSAQGGGTDTNLAATLFETMDTMLLDYRTSK